MLSSFREQRCEQCSGWKKKSGTLPKCCTIKREEVGFHVPKASKDFNSAVECGCNHHTHLRRDYSRLSTTHSISLFHFPFIPLSGASLSCFFKFVCLLLLSLTETSHLNDMGEAFWNAQMSLGCVIFSRANKMYNFVMKQVDCKSGMKYFMMCLWRKTECLDESCALQCIVDFILMPSTHVLGCLWQQRHPLCDQSHKWITIKRVTQGLDGFYVIVRWWKGVRVFP